jgi:putative hydrolase
MLYDFHTHTLLSDGDLGAVELIRRAEVEGYTAIGISDHAAAGNLECVVTAAVRDCELIRRFWKIQAIPGAELTHVPPETIDELAKKAKQLGAKIVVVHGETIVEPVPAGTNLAAVKSPHVDILAHPGLILPEEAALAARNNIFLELSARAGHCLCNGRVASLALEAGARLLVDSDAHAPGDLLNETHQTKVAQGAGLSNAEIEKALRINPEELLKRIGEG